MDLTILFLISGMVVSFLIGRLSIPRIILIAKRKRLFDIPDPRKIHTRRIPRLGGISFMPAILCAYFLMRGLQYSIWGAPESPDSGFTHNMFYFFAGLIAISIVGLWDDITGLSYKYKLGFQLFVAILLVLPAGPIDNLQGIFGLSMLPYWLSMPLTVLLVMVVINSFNLIDGLDGLCSGLSTITFLTLTGLLLYSGEVALALLAAVSIGIVVSFFIYNCFGKKLKVFMGDCGSLTLGYIAAFLLLQLSSLHNTVQKPAQLTLVTLMSLIFIPLFDTIRLFVQRLCRGKSPFCADKNHIHHKFLQIGYTQRQSLTIILALQVAFIAANFVLAGILDINFLLIADFALATGLIAWLDYRIARREIGRKYAQAENPLTTGPANKRLTETT